MKNKVIVAKRMLFICAVFLIIGILLSFFIFKNDIISTIFLLLALIVGLAFLLVNKKYNLIALFGCVILIGGLNFVISFLVYQKNYIDETCNIVCTITKDVNIVRSESVLVEDVAISGENFSKKNKKLNLVLFGGYGEDESGDLCYKAGDVISFTAKVSTASFFNITGGVTSSVTKGCYYYAAVDCKDVDKLENKSNVKITLTNRVYKNLVQNMNKENSALAYAILFGDNDYIEDDLSNAFSGAGLSHLLAVSGLHVSVFFAAIMFLLKRFKVNKYISFISLSVILIFYAYLCGFSPSVVRAIILSLVLTLARLSGRKYDDLNALGFAAFLTLMINPLYLFNVGFLLSYSCVLSIMLFGKYLTGKLAKTIFRRLISVFCISLCTTIGILPFSIKYFSNISIVSLFVNIVFIPIFSVIYILNIISCMLSFVNINFMFKLVAPLFEFFIESTKFIANLGLTIRAGKMIDIFSILIFFVLLFVISRRFMTTKFAKLIVSMVLIIVICLSVFLNNAINKNDIIVYYDYGDRPTIIMEAGSCIVNIDTSKEGLEYLDRVLKAKNIEYINSVVIYSDYTSSSSFSEFVKQYNVLNIYAAQVYIEKIENDVLFSESVYPISQHEQDGLTLTEVMLTNSKSVLYFSFAEHKGILVKDELSYFEKEVIENYAARVEVSSEGVFDIWKGEYFKTHFPYYVIK